MILDIPPTTAQIVIAKAEQQGVSVDKLLLEAFADDEIYFDIDEMKKALGETDEKGRAIHTTEVPKWAMADFSSFKDWLAQRKAQRV